MKKEKKALLIALVIGDGYIHIDKRVKSNKNASLVLRHSSKQIEYLKYKVDLLHSLLGGKKPVVSEYVVKSNYGNFPGCRAEKAHKYFRVLRSWLYPNKYAMIKHLTPHAIAIWYMDDGSIVTNNRYKDGACSSARTNIHLGCKLKADAEVVCNYFKNTWGIKFTTYKEQGTFSIRCFHKEGKKFHSLVHPFIIPSMEYKQRFYYDTSAQPPK